MIRLTGIKITDRIKEADLTQTVLSRYAGVIITRLGFHEVSEDVCSREANIVLHADGKSPDYNNLINELRSIGGIDVSNVEFGSEKTIAPVIQRAGNPIVIALLLEKSPDNARAVQHLLTSYGCNIRTRLGINETFFGEPAGIIILELKGDLQQRKFLISDLSALEKVTVKIVIS